MWHNIMCKARLFQMHKPVTGKMWLHSLGVRTIIQDEEWCKYDYATSVDENFIGANGSTSLMHKNARMAFIFAP